MLVGILCLFAGNASAQAVDARKVLKANKNLVELVDTWYPNPIYGDMDYALMAAYQRGLGKNR